MFAGKVILGHYKEPSNTWLYFSQIDHYIILLVYLGDGNEPILSQEADY